jgi:transcriptional regulator with XRE-family HTH domain
MGERTFLQIFGRRLRYLRKAKGLRQADLAQRIDKTQDAISAYESGSRSIQLKELPVLANALSVSVSSLFYDENSPYFSEELLEGLLSHIAENNSNLSKLLNNFDNAPLSINLFIELIHRGLNLYFEQIEIEKNQLVTQEQLAALQIELGKDLTALEKVLLSAFNDLTSGKSEKEKSNILILSLIRSMYTEPDKFWPSNYDGLPTNGSSE